MDDNWIATATRFAQRFLLSSERVRSMKMKFIKQFRGAVWRVLHAISPALEHQVSKRVSKNCWDNWSYRTRQVMASPDNSYIPRVPEAGKIINGYQIMHNGLKVLSGSYYGKGPCGLFKKNRGVHEPQEERIFQEVLKQVSPGAVMIELGAFWAFYSMWFCQVVPKARAFLVEPLTENLRFGQKNFEANGMQGHFTQALVGKSSGTAPDGTKIICVDDFVAEHRLDEIAILHSDIQGFELDMLHGAERTIRAGKVSYYFISTHNEDLHQACEKWLRERALVILDSIPPSESFSVDGILTARASHAPAIPPISISRKRREP